MGLHAAAVELGPEKDGAGADMDFPGRGLPLRLEFGLDAGAGNKKHHSSRYEYTTVQPPPL